MEFDSELRYTSTREPHSIDFSTDLPTLPAGGEFDDVGCKKIALMSSIEF